MVKGFEVWNAQQHGKAILFTYYIPGIIDDTGLSRNMCNSARKNKLDLSLLSRVHNCCSINSSSIIIIVAFAVVLTPTAYKIKYKKKVVLLVVRALFLFARNARRSQARVEPSPD